MPEDDAHDATSAHEAGGASRPQPSPELSNLADAVAPIVVFIVLNRLFGLRWAVIGATLWSIKVLIARRRRGLAFGRFVPLVTAAVIGRGVIGVVTDSETVYFGLGIATKFGVGVVLATSVLIRRPLAAVAAVTVLPVAASAREHPAFRSAMATVTMIGALYYVLSASFDVWLYRRSSVDGYVIMRFLVNWPLSAVALLAAVAVLRNRLRQVPGLDAWNNLLAGE